jgi:hypothetical protein
MSYQDHLRTCSYCDGTHNPQTQKPTVRIRSKAASTIRRERKLSELAALITGASYPGVSFVDVKTKTKGASSSCVEKSQKLKELARLIRGV